MSKAPKSARADMTGADAAGLMRQMDVGVIPIRDGERLLGLVTDRDLVLRVMAARLDPLAMPLADVMTEPHYLRVAGCAALRGATAHGDHKGRRLPVVKDEELVGILSLGDLATASERTTGEALREISESKPTRPSRRPDPGTPSRVRGDGDDGRA